MNLNDIVIKRICCLSLAIAAKWFCSNNDNINGYEDETIIDVTESFYNWINL